MNSVVSYPTRGVGGRASYRGNCAPQLIADLLDQLHPTMVVDPMGGSYTTRDVCAAKGVACWSSDLREGFDLLSDELPAAPDLGFLHPPYHDMIAYSGAVWGESDSRDLSRAGDYATFITRLNEAQYRLYENLRTGGHMAVLVGDLRRRGQLYPIQRDMAWYGEPVATVIKLQHNTASARKPYAGSFIALAHEYLIITRKPAAWLVTVRKTTASPFDGRSFAGATWKVIAQAGLETLHGQASLPQLYAEVSTHARAKNDTTWQAQIRRALQVYPDVFTPVDGRGTWRLAWRH